MLLSGICYKFLATLYLTVTPIYDSYPRIDRLGAKYLYSLGALSLLTAIHIDGFVGARQRVVSILSPPACVRLLIFDSVTANTLALGSVLMLRFFRRPPALSLRFVRRRATHYLSVMFYDFTHQAKIINKLLTISRFVKVFLLSFLLQR